MRRLALLLSVALFEATAGTGWHCTLAKEDAQVPVPSEAEIRKATRILKEAYAEQYAVAESTKDTRALIRLLRDGSRSSGDHSMQYAQLQEATRLALESQAYDVADDVLSQTSEAFVIDTLAQRVSLLKTMADSKDTQDPELFELAMEIAKTCLVAERLDEAEAAAKVAGTIAKHIATAERKEIALQRRKRQQAASEEVRAGQACVDRADRLRASVKMASEGKEAYQAALTALAAQPSDAAANTLVGRYKALALGQWQAALPFLTKGTEASLAALASGELRLREADGVRPEELFELASRWWDASEAPGQSLEEATGIKSHASALYAESAPTLIDPVKLALAQKRGGEESARVARLAGPAGGLAALATSEKAPAAAPLPATQRLRVGEVVVFLSDLPERNAHVGFGEFGKNGELGNFGRKVKVNGVLSPKGISLHGATDGEARVTYEVPNKARLMVAGVAIADDASNSGKGGSVTPLTFRVLGPGGEVMWQTQQPMQQLGELRQCVVDVSRVQSITLSVLCPGTNDHAMAVWVEPFFIARPSR
jgi:hypothetical protein